MTQRLIKNIVTKFIPGDPGSPGYPGLPSTPAHTYVTDTEQCFWAPGNYLLTREQILRFLMSNNLPVDGFGMEYTGGAYHCISVPTTVHVPYSPGRKPKAAVPATPSQTLSDFQLGWTGRAHSIPAMEQSGKFSFRVLPSAIGAVVGLSADPKDSGYGDILYGFYVTKGITKIIESGAEVMPLGDRSGQTLEIRRTKGAIEYRVNGALEYSRASTPGTMLLSASLYSGGDEVVDPTFEAFGDGYASGSVGPFIGFGATGGFARGVAQTGRFVSSAYAYGHGEGGATMATMRGTGGISYAWGQGMVPTLVGRAESLGEAPTISLAMSETIAMTSSATGVSGGNGAAMHAMTHLTSMAGQGTGRGVGRAAMSPPRSTVYSTFANDEAFVVGTGDTGESPITCDVELVAVMNSDAQVVGLVVLSIEYIAEVLGAASASSGLGVQLELEAMLASLMQSSSLLSNPASVEPNNTWVYNVDMQGTTRYDHFDFNSFATIGGRHFGARPDGIYELVGPDDAGTDVTVSVDFGDLNFGTLNRKALPMCYAGAASDGKLMLRVVADGQTHTYVTTDFDPQLKAQRFVLGRGLRASFYNVTLINQGGSAFALDSIQFMPVTLTRRQ